VSVSAPYPQAVPSHAKSGHAGIEFLSIVDSATTRLQARPAGGVPLLPAEATRRLAQVVQAARVSRSSLARLEPAAVAVALFGLSCHIRG